MGLCFFGEVLAVLCFGLVAVFVWGGCAGFALLVD